MDSRLILLALGLVIVWICARWWSARAARTVYISPAFRLTVTPERAQQLAEQRNRLALDAEGAALARGEQSDMMYAARVRALSRAPIAEMDTPDPFDRG